MRHYCVAAAFTSAVAAVSTRLHHTGSDCCHGVPSHRLTPPRSSLCCGSGTFSPASLHSCGLAVPRGGQPLQSSRSTAAAASSTTPLTAQQRQCSSSSNNNNSGGGDGATFADGTRPYVAGQTVQEKFPIVQLPARSLWCRQYALDPRRVQQGEYADLIAQVKAARHYYQYPSLSAPQNGWNVQMFALFDNSVFINPVNLDEEVWRAEAARRNIPWVVFEEEKMQELRAAGQTGFAWEPCASSGFMLHYIERPLTVRIKALDEHGVEFTATLDRMRGRMALHELDHLQGVLFTRRVVDTDHVVPMEGFVTMSDWSDDYPSLEARSTFLYTIFTPPYSFVTDAVEDGNLLDRKFEDGIYPGCEQDRQQRIESAAVEELQRQAWRTEKKKQQAATAAASTAVAGEEGKGVKCSSTASVEGDVQ